MTAPRVSDERLAEIRGHLTDQKRPFNDWTDNMTRDLVDDLRNARARLAAWEPVVGAAVAYEDSRWRPDRIGDHRQTIGAQIRAENGLRAAVDALPPEMRP